jgi:hypothetical protein
MRILIAVYAILIVTELFFCVPYHKIQTLKSEQNVPHVVTIGSGYTTMYDVANDTAHIGSIGKIVNTPQLLINVSITTFLAVAIYFLLRQQKTKQTIENNTDELLERAIKEKDMQLQQALKDIQLLQAQNMGLDSKNKELSRKYTEVVRERIKQMPTLDINGLAFADDETIAEAQIDYAKKMAEYVKKKGDL